MSPKVIGCVFIGHRWATAENDDGPDTLLVCRWCGRRELLAPGTSLLEWRAYRSLGRGRSAFGNKRL